VHEALPRSISSDCRFVRFGLISVRCQTVPSPFGSGLGDFEVAPWSSTLCCRKRRSEEERRSLYPETCSTHDERQLEMLTFRFAVSIDSGSHDSSDAVHHVGAVPPLPDLGERCSTAHYHLTRWGSGRLEAMYD
jgi:hypothetical protein